MGCCPCFGLLRAKKPKSENNMRYPSYVSTRESVSKMNSDLRPESSTPKDGCITSNMSVTFTYEELEIATNYFSQESFLGRGGFGAVYKGKLEGNGHVVAVKRLDPTGFQGDKEFLVEVLMLSLMRHPNLVNLIGYCAEGEQRLLVYEYMPFGSLEDHLFDLTRGMKPLDWMTRMKIAAGAAKGLDYLHSANPPVIYRDLKVSNILLDEDFHPKLSDFGLAKFGPVGDNSHVSTRVMGTYGYCAPEYALSGRLTNKTDIYSYGIVLLELITGRRAVEQVDGRQKYLLNWALPLMEDNDLTKLADPLLRGRYSKSALTKITQIIQMCLSENVKRRPTSSDLALVMDYFASPKNEPKAAKKVTVKWPEIDLSPSDTELILDKELDRDRAVAEAKLWGESWRKKRLCSPLNISDGNTQVST